MLSLGAEADQIAATAFEKREGRKKFDQHPRGEGEGEAGEASLRVPSAMTSEKGGRRKRGKNKKFPTCFLCEKREEGRKPLVFNAGKKKEDSGRRERRAAYLRKEGERR